MAEQKQSNKERMREIVDSIESGIKELFESDKYRQYLSTMSRFHRYSVNNTMLIYMQMPDATLVAGFNKWKNQFERHVKKGEHGITIIAPTPYKKKIEEQKLDPDTKAPMLDKDGKVITEEKEIEIPMFRPVKVFDVSQTDGKPLPQLASDLAGNVQQYDVFMEALRRSSSVPISIEPITDGADGYFSLTDQRIAIREGMSQVQTISAVVHEIAHSKLHNYEKEQQEAAAGDETKESPKKKDRHTEEVEAESISYAVCQYYGIQTGDNSFGYIATWSQGKELAELKASLETINKTASGLITDIDRHFKEICKERGIDLSAEQEQTAAEVTSEPEKAEGMFRYYITPEALAHGSYPFMLGGQTHETVQLTEYEGGAVKSYGYIDYPQPLSEKQIAESALLPCKENSVQQKVISYYVAECMEFPTLGEWHENLSLDEAVQLYHSIPAERMSGIKGIGFDLQDGSDYSGQFPILTGKTIDVELINDIDYFRNSPVVQKAVSDLIAAMPEMEVLKTTVHPEVIETIPEQAEALYLLDDAAYLHIQSCDTGWDYTLYEKETMREIDGGQLDDVDASHRTLADARTEIFALAGMEPVKVDAVDLDVLEQLQEAQLEPASNSKIAELIDHFAAEDAALEQVLDEYPMPDESLTAAYLEACGYMDGDMLPLSKEEAIQLYEKDLTVYAIVDGGGAEMLFDREDFDAQAPETIFAVGCDEWEQSPEFHKKVRERLSHQEEREHAFLTHEDDCFAIYQLKHEDAQAPLLFCNMDWLESHGLSVERDNYDLVYTGLLAGDGNTNTGATLEMLYEQFNLHHPADYHSHSLSVSDIVAIKRDGEVSYHYCDSIGFQELPSFQKPENYLKAAELSTEDDYGMIDGVINNGKAPSVAELEQQSRSGQPISLMDLADAVHREQQEKKKSVVEKLKTQPKQEHKKTTPQRSAGREI